MNYDVLHCVASLCTTLDRHVIKSLDPHSALWLLHQALGPSPLGLCSFMLDFQDGDSGLDFGPTIELHSPIYRAMDHLLRELPQVSCLRRGIEIEQFGLFADWQTAVS